jgi:diguanylate cyclase (GGDEF)-like protein/PAS domain S-box-containing protein
MSTHKRLAIAFLMLLAFFGINVVIHSWGSARRSASFEVLRQAITRQALLEAAGKELGNVQKEMALLSEVYSTSAGPMDAAETARFERQLGSIRESLQELERLSEGAARAPAGLLATRGEELLRSWKTAYGNLGGDNARAIRELSVRAEPLSRQVVQELLPRVQAAERSRVESARENFYAVARLTDRVAFAIFLLTAVLGVFVAVTISREVRWRNRQLEERVEERTRELEMSLSLLRDSEERYALAAHGANDGLWDWDLQLREVYYSPRWKSMLGYDDEEIGASLREWFGRIHPDDRETLGMQMAAHLEGLTPHFEHEHRVRTKDGTYLWVLARGNAVQQGDGQPYRMAGSLTDVTQRKRTEEQLLHDAFHDALTGLANRALFMDRLEVLLAKSRGRAPRKGEPPFAVLFLDLDRFKVVNDGLGHVAGDRLLVAIARRLEECLRPGDSVARLGGDEFTVLLDGLDSTADALRIADRIQEELSRPFEVAGQEVFTTASIGVAFGGKGYREADELLRDVDTAMYRAKALGKARAEVFDEAMRARAVEILQLETQLRRALERRELRLFYQPIVRLQTGEIDAVEALVRWESPERGLVAVGEFLPVAEDSGLIVPIGEWVISEACRQLRAWDEVLGPRRPLAVNINVSGREFIQPDLVACVRDALAETGLDPARVRIEITESVIMDDAMAAEATLARLRALGVKLHMDDFGTGYSSMSHLRDFRLDALKIDRSFVGHIGPAGEHAEIVRTIVALGHNLGLEVVAEGVETAEQAALLRSLGCEYGQGFHFARPLRAEEARILLVEAQQAAS